MIRNYDELIEKLKPGQSKLQAEHDVTDAIRLLVEKVEDQRDTIRSLESRLSRIEDKSRSSILAR